MKEKSNNTLKYNFLIPKLNKFLLENGKLEINLNGKKRELETNGLEVLVLKNIKEKDYSIIDKLSKMVLETFKEKMFKNNIKPINNNELYQKIFNEYIKIINNFNLDFEIKDFSEINMEHEEAILFDNEENPMKRKNPENFGTENLKIEDGMSL